MEKIVFGLAVLAPVTQPVLAQDSDAIIVTATRTAETTDESLASVSVIDRSDIELSQAQNLPQLLSAYAGIDFATSGGYGKSTYLYLRGSNKEHVLVLIDGMRIGSATSGAAALQYLPMDQIDRIEIVRGPRSSLYGSDAIGGVIQIFTRKGTESLRSHARVGAGSYNTRELAAGVSGRKDKLGYSLQLSQFSTDNIDAKTTENPDLDPYNNSSVSASLDYTFTTQNKLAVNLMQASGANSYDGSGASVDYKNNYLQQAASLRWDTAPAEAWQMQLQAGQSQDKSLNLTDGVDTSRFDTLRTSLSWQNDFALNANNLLTAGIDQLQDKVDSSKAYAVTSRTTTGAFAQYQWGGKNGNLQIGIRADDIEGYGQQNTGNIGWGYQLSDSLRLIASSGTAFKAPTFNQLYYPGYGNPALMPESSTNLELGLRGKLVHGRWGISLFSNKVENLIAYDSAISAFNNIANANINGLEMTLSKSTGAWNTRASLTTLAPRDTDTDKLLQRRASQTLQLDVDRSLGKWEIGAGILMQGERFDDKANTVKLDGYSLLNLRSRYNVNKQLSIRAKIDNVMDEKYQTIDGYNSLGINAMLGFEYQTD